MSKPLKLPPPGFDDLSIEEKLDYVQGLWDHISADADSLPLTDWQERVLRERLAAYEANPDAGVSWDELHERLRRKLARREG